MLKNENFISVKKIDFKISHNIGQNTLTPGVFSVLASIKNYDLYMPRNGESASKIVSKIILFVKSSTALTQHGG